MTRACIAIFIGLFFSSVSRAQEPALIPMPAAIEWTTGVLPVNSIRFIQSTDPALTVLANALKDSLANHGSNPVIVKNRKTGSVAVELLIQPVALKSATDEGYELEITPKGVRITSPSDTGVFYGIRTLLQMIQAGRDLPACKIADNPSYAWRGYMVDVGRNYQSMELLKAQIDRMAQYKLNTFHFHVTEDIAWRLEIDGFPALTADSTMLRDIGMYYSKEDVHELIRYCKDRYIRFLLEVDMPGHSAAFERATGVSMQSEEGSRLVKEIIRKIAASYPLRYLHIGGDEVKIINPGFLPAMAKLLDSLGIRSVGWSPGGNIPASAIHQLWMAEAPIKPGIQYLDSRHLYLNHMDPLEAVVTLFHRQIGDRPRGDSTVLGGILCVWNDRRLTNENYHLLLNGVYPSMLAFAERAWRGGGEPKWTAVIGARGSEQANQFLAFETRLMKHKQLFFPNAPFPYYKQSGLTWKLYGPYQNEGAPQRSFAPETSTSADLPAPALEVTGGTVILRHWWAPAITGHLPDPKENTTWYAQTQIWSEQDGVKDCWIGFSNFSRSMVTRAPASGTWDERGSTIWINGTKQQPPNWKRAGRSISLETPLTDEDYYYRKPNQVYLKKGWNTVLVKLPVTSFKGSDWQNPVKWMFSFMVLDQ